MADRRNPQTIAVNANATALINISNPSQVSPMYIWAYDIGAQANCNLGFLNQPNSGQAAGVLAGYQAVTALTGLVATTVGPYPLFTVDPNANFVINNPNSVQLGGWIQISS
jgi:hypothetical protein